MKLGGMLWEARFPEHFLAESSEEICPAARIGDPQFGGLTKIALEL